MFGAEEDKVEVSKEVVETSKPGRKPKTLTVKKLIKNPLRLSMTNILSTFDPYALSDKELKDKAFMKHIDKLIGLGQIEKVS